MSVDLIMPLGLIATFIGAASMGNLFGLRNEYWYEEFWRAAKWLYRQMTARATAERE